jgi:adenylylsulfate kinase-like enzyme
MGFSMQDHTKNIQRIRHVAQLMANANLVILVALISPY